MNGTMFVSPEEIRKEDLTAEALERVVITETPDEGAPVTSVLENAVCDTVLHWPEGWLFNVREKTIEEIQAETIAALKSENNMLVECILEISEVVYGE